jgi:hypothetical protein
VVLQGQAALSGGLAAEAKARQALAAASAAEQAATSNLDLCATRAVVAAVGEDAAAAYLPRLIAKGSRAEANDAAE